MLNSITKDNNKAISLEPYLFFIVLLPFSLSELCQIIRFFRRLEMPRHRKQLIPES